MASITVRIDPETGERVRRCLEESGGSLSEFVREAIEEKLARRTPERTPYEMAVEMGIIGSYKGPPISSERTDRKRLVAEAVRAKHRH